MSLDLVLLYGSVRTERRGIRLVRFLERELAARGHGVTVVDPLEYRLPLLDRMYKEYGKGEAPDVLERLAVIHQRADAFVIVTGEYNHSAPPALMNLLDHFLEEYFWRPSAIVSYSNGAFGGARSAVHLRAPLGELGMPSIPSILSVARVQDVLTEAGALVDPDATLGHRFPRFASELEWYAAALKAARAGGVPY